MSENPVRPNIDATAGGADRGWGAPLKADHGPADFRRSGLLFSAIAGMTPTPAHASAAGSAVPSGVGAWAPRSAGPSARPAQAPARPLRQRTPDQAPPRLRAVPSAPSVRTVTHLDLHSVARVSAVFYGVVLVVMVVASVLLWFIADAAGAVHSIDRSVQSLFGVKSYSLHPGTVAMYACAAGVVVALAGTALNVLAAAVYNQVAEVVGGVKMRVTDT